MSLKSVCLKNDDELRLARLACGRMVGLIEGAVSIGVPAIVSGVPDPLPFWERQFRNIDAFAIVLDTVSWPVGDFQRVRQLRDVSADIRRVLAELKHEIDRIMDSHEALGQCAGPAQAAASKLFDCIQSYASLIRLDAGAIITAKATVMAVFNATHGLEEIRIRSAS